MMMTTEGQPRGRRPRLARGTIVAWLVLIVAVTLVSILLAANTVLREQIVDGANREVAQEIEEFHSFAASAVDPETGRSFASGAALVEAFLARQRPGTGEVLVGLEGPGATPIASQPGPGAPADYDPAQDEEFRAAVLVSAAGSRDTPAGTMQWGRATVDGEDRAMLVVVNFTAGAQSEVNGVMRTLTVLSLAGLTFAGVVSWLVAGRILRPVRLVHEAAAEITERDLTRRIPVGDDDVAGLAATFNRMLDRLESAFEAEQRFVDDAGHELRTPITIIRGHLELMDEDPASREATMRIVTQELDRMGRIVTDLLALAKSDRPDFIHPRPGVDVAAMTLAIDAKVGALADRKWQLSHVAEGTATLDAQRITQAVLQLAQNAATHTAVGDRITLSSRFVRDGEDAQALAITVEDTGPGVAPADRERIFERFAHGETPDGRRHSGAGLGLPIVKAIAEAHGGRVEVGGTIGQGASFTLVVPVHDAAERADDTASTMPIPAWQGQP